MKKLIFMVGTVVTLMAATTAKAQDDNMLFNHLSVGASIGVMDGLGVEVATPCTNYLNVRAGFSGLPFPSITVKDVEVSGDNKKEKVDLKAKVKKMDFKLLFDIHPFRNSSFRVTLGTYIGNSEFLSAENENQMADYSNKYIKIGDHKIGFDKNGYTKASIKVNSFRPYAGIGFGRAISRNNKWVCNFDLGCQFWGTPKVYGYDIKDKVFQEIKAEEIDNEDGKEAMKWISKVKVCPTLSFRVVYNIF